MNPQNETIENIKYSKWRPDYTKNVGVLQQYNITTNVAYRKFMMNHGKDIMKLNQVTEHELCCQRSLQTSQQTKNVPFMYSNEDIYNSEQFAYPESDLKQNYMQKYDDQSSKRAINL
tara:strand:+ start:461 stop:811 length:351 start_codon:yes stop_codon:yes gene_type:complete